MAWSSARLRIRSFMFWAYLKQCTSETRVPASLWCYRRRWRCNGKLYIPVEPVVRLALAGPIYIEDNRPFLSGTDGDIGKRARVANSGGIECEGRGPVIEGVDHFEALGVHNA